MNSGSKRPCALVRFRQGKPEKRLFVQFLVSGSHVRVSSPRGAKPSGQVNVAVNPSSARRVEMP